MSADDRVISYTRDVVVCHEKHSLKVFHSSREIDRDFHRIFVNHSAIPVLDNIVTFLEEDIETY